MSIIRPPLKLIQIFPNNTLQRVVLNGQNSSWIPVFAGILLAGFSFQTSQGSAGFRPLFFLISINYLAEGISWTIAIRNLLLMIYHCFLLSITLNEYAILFFKLGFTPCKAEQPLGMELQEKKHKKDQIWIYKRYHSRLTSGQCLSILTSPSKRRKLFSKRKMFPIPFCNMLFLPKAFRHLSW